MFGVLWTRHSSWRLDSSSRMILRNAGTLPGGQVKERIYGRTSIGVELRKRKRLKVHRCRGSCNQRGNRLDSLLYFCYGDRDETRATVAADVRFDELSF